MTESKLTDEEKAFIKAFNDRLFKAFENIGLNSNAEIAKRLGINQKTVYNWRIYLSCPNAVQLLKAMEHDVDMVDAFYGMSKESLFGEVERLNAANAELTKRIAGIVTLATHGIPSRPPLIEKVVEAFAKCTEREKRMVLVALDLPDVDLNEKL